MDAIETHKLKTRQAILNLARLRAKPASSYPGGAYQKVCETSKAYFDLVKSPRQYYCTALLCLEVAFRAFKDAHIVGGAKFEPEQYVLTEEDSQEVLALFQSFIDMYQEYFRNQTRHYAAARQTRGQER